MDRSKQDGNLIERKGEEEGRGILSSEEGIHGGAEDPFVNRYGVVIGDNRYNSPKSPLNHWSKEIDPAIMAGDEWIHPTNDIGWRTEANRQLREYGLAPQGLFMHPTIDAGYQAEDPEEGPKS